MATYYPKEVALAFREVTTPAQALAAARSGIATLSRLSRTMGGAKVEALMKLYLIELNELLGLKTPLSEAQIEAVAEEIPARYPYLTMADVNLVFRRLRCGECGRLYDRLTMPQLMRAFADYNDERCEEAARQARAEAESFRAERERSSPRGMAAWRDALKASFLAAARARAGDEGAEGTGGAGGSGEGTGPEGPGDPDPRT